MIRPAPTPRVGPGARNKTDEPVAIPEVRDMLEPTVRLPYPNT